MVAPRASTRRSRRAKPNRFAAPTGTPVSAPKPSSHFGYSAKLTEILLAGVVAWRTGEKLTYDMDKGTFNNAKADALIWRTPRKGWEFGYPV